MACPAGRGGQHSSGLFLFKPQCVGFWAFPWPCCQPDPGTRCSDGQGWRVTATKMHGDAIVWVWAAPIDSKVGLRGPGLRGNSVNLSGTETDDFNQQAKNMTSRLQQTEGGSVRLPGSAGEALPESLARVSASSQGLPCEGPPLSRPRRAGAENSPPEWRR